MNDSEHDVNREAFLERIGFEPDRFQTESFDALDAGEHVIVAAPTGAGKTLIASYAVDRAMAHGRRVFYTTPIKALSNQKYHDLVAEYGSSSVGLLTGDNVINGDASVVVMTTEVLRNMLYAGRTLDGLEAVVLDEVHYLQDSYRGPVWEEVIIHLPTHVQLVALSATVSNAPELREWMETVRGSTRLVTETQRPVELENLYLVAERGSSKLHMIRTLQGGKANGKGFRFDADFRTPNRGQRRGPKGGRRPRVNWITPSRVDVVRQLKQKDLLPAIHFIFSRNACTDASRAVVDSGMVLTTQAERTQIREIVASKTAGLDSTDLDVLEFDRFLRGLEAGVAHHHAGMVPPLKEAVEACFVRGLTKIVFATETLALGINMPARTVVLDKLTKYTGDGHESLTPAQFTQLTGRAGRRGIDSHGQAVVLWSPWVRFEQVAKLAASKEFVLTSAFRPTYNMTANLVRRYDQPRARQLLNLSFAQFRSDANIVRGEHRLEKVRRRRVKIEANLADEFGAIDDLRAAIETVDLAQSDIQELSFALSQVTLGDVLELDGTDLFGDPLPKVAVAISVAYRKGRRVKVVVVDEQCETFEIAPDTLATTPTVIGSIVLPEPYLPHSMSFIFEVGKLLTKASHLATSRRRLGPTGKIQSVADVPPQARKMLRRMAKLDAEIVTLQKAAARSASSLGRQFDEVVGLLTERGFVEDWMLTNKGERLARLYHECDLFLIEALDAGIFDGLNPAEMTAMTSSFIYEERGPNAGGEPWYPNAELRKRFGALTRIHWKLAKQERAAGLAETRTPHAGFMAIAYGWASGGGLNDVLSEEEVSAGDFVRTARLLIDLLRQISVLAPERSTRKAASKASDAVHRDLVAASSMVGSEDDQPLDPEEVSSRSDSKDLDQRTLDSFVRPDQEDLLSSSEAFPAADDDF